MKIDPGAPTIVRFRPPPLSGGLVLPDPGGPEGNVVCGRFWLHRAEGLPIKVIAASSFESESHLALVFQPAGTAAPAISATAELSLGAETWPGEKQQTAPVQLTIQTLAPAVMD